MNNVIKVLVVLSIIVTGSNSFAQSVKDAQDRAKASLEAKASKTETNTGIQNVGLVAKVNSQSGQYYKVSGKVTYLNNGDSVEHTFENVGVFFDAHGKLIEGSEDGSYATYLYIGKNSAGKTVLYATVFYIPTLPDTEKGTSNGVEVPAPQKEVQRQQDVPSTFTLFKM